MIIFIKKGGRKGILSDNNVFRSDDCRAESRIGQWKIALKKENQKRLSIFVFFSISLSGTDGLDHSSRT